MARWYTIAILVCLFSITGIHPMMNSVRKYNNQSAQWRKAFKNKQYNAPENIHTLRRFKLFLSEYWYVSHHFEKFCSNALSDKTVFAYNAVQVVDI